MEKTANQERVGEAAPPGPMTATQAVQHIQSQTGDPRKFKIRERGYVDWKFGELAEYLGFAGALAYVYSMRNWYNYPEKYAGCRLDETYAAFEHAVQLVTT